MKFVKGDAIAGIVVAGGQHRRRPGHRRRCSAGSTSRPRRKTYTVLTIGEGLVSQIPALVISTSAGIIVTRVASEEEGGHLGRDIGLQVMAQPKAIAIAAGLLLLLAVVPGLPGVPFVTLGGGARARRVAAAAHAGGGRVGGDGRRRGGRPAAPARRRRAQARSRPCRC